MPPDGAQRGRPLHGDERTMVRAQQSHPGGQPRRQMRVVRLLGGGVDDQEQHAVLGRIGRPCHHQVVEDAAVVVEQLRVALAAGREPRDVAGDKRLERARDRPWSAPTRNAWPMWETSNRPA